MRWRESWDELHVSVEVQHPLLQLPKVFQLPMQPQLHKNNHKTIKEPQILKKSKKFYFHSQKDHIFFQITNNQIPKNHNYTDPWYSQKKKKGSPLQRITWPAVFIVVDLWLKLFFLKMVFCWIYDNSAPSVIVRA